MSETRYVWFLTPETISLSSVQGQVPTVLLSSEFLAVSPSKKPYHYLPVTAPSFLPSAVGLAVELAEEVKMKTKTTCLICILENENVW